MNKGAVSDIKSGMLVQIEVSSGPDKGIVSTADTDLFNVIFLDNSGENIPACVSADEIVCAWDISRLPTYVIGDLLQGRGNSWKSMLDNAVVYRRIRTESVEMTLEEISEIVSKHLGKSVSVSVSVRESESESGKSESAKTEEEPNDYSESGRVEVAVGDFIKRDGITYRCVEDAPQTSPSCVGCAFYEDKFCANITCSAYCREDDKSVHFVEVEEAEPGRDVFIVPDNGFIEYDAPIGEEFEIKGLRYRVIEDTRDPNTECDGCALKSDGLCDYYRGFCASERVDGKTILFKRVHTEEK